MTWLNNMYRIKLTLSRFILTIILIGIGSDVYSQVFDAPDFLNSARRSESILDRYIDRWNRVKKLGIPHVDAFLSIKYYTGFDINTVFGPYNSELVSSYASIIIPDINLTNNLFGQKFNLDIGLAGNRTGLRIRSGFSNPLGDPAGSGGTVRDFFGEQYFDDLLMTTWNVMGEDGKPIVYIHVGLTLVRAFKPNRDGTLDNFLLFNKPDRTNVGLFTGIYIKKLFGLTDIYLDSRISDELDYASFDIPFATLLQSETVKVLDFSIVYYNYARFYPGNPQNLGISENGNMTFKLALGINYLPIREVKSVYNDPELLIAAEIFSPDYSRRQDGAVARSIKLEGNISASWFAIFLGGSYFSDIRLRTLFNSRSVFGFKIGLKASLHRDSGFGLDFMFKYSKSYSDELTTFVEAAKVDLFHFSLALSF